MDVLKLWANGSVVLCDAMISLLEKLAFGTKKVEDGVENSAKTV